MLGSDSKLCTEIGSQHTKMNEVGVLALRELTQHLVRWAHKQRNAIQCDIIKDMSKGRDGLCESGMIPYKK